MSAAAIEQALILAGGLGTRFRAVSADTPKGLADVGGKPIVERQIEDLRAAGVTRVVLCVGHMADAVEAHFGDGRRLGVEIAYSHERELLGTAGAMLHARPALRPGPFLALNGDSIVAGLDYAAFGREHARRAKQSHSTAGSIVVIRPPDAGAYGVLELDTARERILRFREKAPLDPADAGALINAGVYALEPRFFDHVAPGRPVSIEYEAFPACIRAGAAVWAFRHEGFFGDIGTPEGYRRVREQMADKRTGGRE